MRRGETKGYYTNFDVSNQEQRKSWYFFAIALLAATIVILFATNQPHAIRFGFLLSALLLLCSQILNYIQNLFSGSDSGAKTGLKAGLSRGFGLMAGYYSPQ